MALFIIKGMSEFIIRVRIYNKRYRRIYNAGICVFIIRVWEKNGKKMGKKMGKF